MKDSNEKKITELKVYKIIMIIYSIAMAVLCALTIYGWATGTEIIGYTPLGICCATYCSSAAVYENLKKKQAKKKEI